MRSLIIEIEPFRFFLIFAAIFFLQEYYMQNFDCKNFPEMTMVTPVRAVISPTVPELKLYFDSDNGLSSLSSDWTSQVIASSNQSQFAILFSGTDFDPFLYNLNQPILFCFT